MTQKMMRSLRSCSDERLRSCKVVVVIEVVMVMVVVVRPRLPLVVLWCPSSLGPFLINHIVFFIDALSFILGPKKDAGV